MQQLQGVEIVWHEEWYDGPLTGLARYDKQLHWFTPASDAWYDESPRRYLLHRLSDEERTLAEERRADGDLLSPEEFWTRYHSDDRDQDGYQQHDGEVLGYFLG